MIYVHAMLAAALLGASGGEARPRLIERGHDAAAGVLVNLTPGARPFDPADPARPTVVVVHGLNPYHPVLRFAMAERYAEVIGRRHGAAVNVLGWDWNAATMPSVRPSIIRQNAKSQGHALAAALGRAGVDPARLHLIGHSSGCVAATTAARIMTDRTGRRVGRLTLLDPSELEHPILFEELAAPSTTASLVHIWVPGASGFGAHVNRPGVTNIRVDGPRGALGLLNPLRLDHLYAVEWHLQQIGR